MPIDWEWFPKGLSEEAISPVELALIVGVSIGAQWAWFRFRQWRQQTYVPPEPPPPPPPPPEGLDYPLGTPVWVKRYSTLDDVYVGTVVGYMGNSYVVKTRFETGVFERSCVSLRYPGTEK